ncbi:MAG: ABC transporter substrate-binding protein, partial [Chitinophagales bacterium]|nr:ABC transporter substrate-binding protein [Chitinophagales bacterium]
MRKMLIYTFLLCLIFSACEKSVSNNTTTTSQNYAEGFIIQKSENYTDISILTPWQDSRTQFSYTVGDADLNDLALRKTAIINDRIRSVICLSTTHIAFLDALGLTDRIVGVANGKFVFNESVRNAIDEGRVVDLGSDSELDFEKIVDLNADIILTYAIDEGFMMNYDRLMELEQKVIVISEYLETSPLGQSEWLKVYGVLFDRERKADSVFADIEKEYLEIKAAPILSNPPRVFCNTPWKEVWYMPGGHSFT